MPRVLEQSQMREHRQTPSSDTGSSPRPALSGLNVGVKSGRVDGVTNEPLQAEQRLTLPCSKTAQRRPELRQGAGGG